MRGMKPPNIFLYVQNLLGIGHLRRAAAISRALTEIGLEVNFVSGGIPIPNLNVGRAKFHQLPPVRSLDRNFKVLVDETGREIDDNWRQNRCSKLLNLFEETKPSMILTELFPFGRRQFRFELMPLLDRAQEAKWKPQIVASMRDILVTKSRHDRNMEISRTLTAYYDKVLVHGDKQIITLEETFPLSQEITHLVEYTGYVLNPSISDSKETVGSGEVVVSFGGGAVGSDTLTKLFKIRREKLMDDTRWRFIVGPHMPEEILHEVKRSPIENTIIERMRPDLPSLINRARLSISQAGYNTVAEVLSSNTPAILVPFEGGDETEQRIRADLLAKRGAVEVVYEDKLDSQTLTKAITRALKDQTKTALKIDLKGAERTAKILSKMI
tara:strand:+ start:141 stop:1292 length:1152 start_codon:yes stop_codon:yes gene_type:complete